MASVHNKLASVHEEEDEYLTEYNVYKMDGYS